MTKPNAKSRKPRKDPIDRQTAQAVKDYEMTVSSRGWKEKVADAQAQGKRMWEVRKRYPTEGITRAMGFKLLNLLHAAGQVDKADPTVWLDTPARWVKMLDEVTAGYKVNIPELFKTFERGAYDGLVVVGAMPFYSMCEHHLMPFHGKAWVGYLPNATGRIVGLSKIARLVDAHAKRLQVQERMTHDIAADLQNGVSAEGVGVRVEAVHTCMCARGVQTDGITRTQTILGAFKDKAELRAEFIDLCHAKE